MVDKVIAGHNVRLYDTIDEMPIARFHRLEKYLLIDAGIGGDIASFDLRLDKMRRYMAKGKSDLAMQEAQNLRQCVYLIQSGLNPKHRAFAVLVESIDGEKMDDLSDSGLERVQERLKDMTVAEAESMLGSVKKKIRR